MRAVLALFEGGVTGAADGYGRMADRPAATLLHLGPGLGNGLANLHNARRAHTPIVNIVGDHATYHKQYDAPLESDIDAIAGSVSGWVRRSATTAEDVATDAADAIAAASSPPGQVATLILPADVSWSDGGTPGAAGRAASRGPRSVTTWCASVADVLGSGEPAVVLVGGAALREDGLRRGQPGRRGDRRPAARRDVPGPARTGRRPPGRRAARLPGRARRSTS